jgi:hypothetical protein
MPRKKVHHKIRKKSFFKRFSKGIVSPSILFVLLLVLLIFLGSMFVSRSPSVQQPETTQNKIPVPTYLLNDTGGGLHTLALTPLPTLASGSAQKCTLITNDIVLVIDKSGSMRGVKLEEAKIAASIFVDLISLNPQSRVGLVVFDKTSTVLSPLSSDFPAVKNSIDQITNGSNTCIQCGALTANEQIASALRDNVKRSAVLLSDGKANHVNGQRSSNAKAVALTEIQRGSKDVGISYYGIAFGEDADWDFMLEVSTSTGGTTYGTVSEEELAKAFSLVASDICQ